MPLRRMERFRLLQPGERLKLRAAQAVLARTLAFDRAGYRPCVSRARNGLGFVVGEVCLVCAPQRVRVRDAEPGTITVRHNLAGLV